MPARDATGTSALEFMPPRASLSALRSAARGCRGCPLYRNATQTVFGEGRRNARVILVGEQPGNDEDLEGHPFVGPAGRVLDQGLQAAGIARDDAYVTNVVKHFKWIPKGKRRMHQKPGAREIAACLPWLEKEIELIKPQVLVLMGATAAQALLGRDFKVTRMRGKVLTSPLAPHAVTTVHPSSILRQTTREERHREMDRFTRDLEVVAGLLNGRAKKKERGARSGPYLPGPRGPGRSARRRAAPPPARRARAACTTLPASPRRPPPGASHGNRCLHLR